MGTSQCLSDLLGMVAAFQCIVASVDEPNESLTREVENDFLGLASLSLVAEQRLDRTVPRWEVRVCERSMSIWSDEAGCQRRSTLGQASE
jgi:hypothetical protein